jgi:hypothetical protein
VAKEESIDLTKIPLGLLMVYILAWVSRSMMSSVGVEVRVEAHAVHVLVALADCVLVDAHAIDQATLPFSMAFFTVSFSFSELHACRCSDLR